MANDQKYYRSIFLFSVITLLINDLFLKEYFHNYLTGKLSDLISLTVLPFSYYYFHISSDNRIETKINIKPIITLICCFAFTATTLQRENGEIKLKSNLEIQLEITEQEAVSKLNLISINEYDTFYCKTQIKDIGAEITSKIILIKEDNNFIRIKLDSIIDFEITGSLFSGADQDDLKYLKSLNSKDFEKLYFEQEFIKLYQK